MITILTVSTKGVPKNLAKTAKEFGYELKVLGIGKKWTGFLMKSELFFEELNQSQYKDSDLFILADAYDLVATGHCNNLLDKYDKIHKEGYTMVAGCERFCYTNVICYEKAAANHPEAHKNHFNRYTNGGFVMGEKSSLIDYVQFVLNDRGDEQYLLGKYAHDHPNKVFLDTHATVIYNMRPEDGTDITKLIQHKSVRSPYCEEFLSFVHAPGVGSGIRHTTNYNSLLQSIVGDDHDPIPHNPVGKCKELLFNYKKERNIILVGFLGLLLLSIFWRCTHPSGMYAPSIVTGCGLMGLLGLGLFFAFHSYYY